MIVDASVVAKWFLPDEDPIDQTRAIRDAMLAGTIPFAAPLVLWSELSNAVVRATRRGRIDYERAISIASEFSEVEPLIEAIDVDSHAAIHVALTTGLNAYDAQYLASARRGGPQVLTADRRMFEIGRTYGYETLWLGDITLRHGVLVDTPQGYQ